MTAPKIISGIPMRESEKTKTKPKNPEIIPPIINPGFANISDPELVTIMQ
jgi:hypothetical protein